MEYFKIIFTYTEPISRTIFLFPNSFLLAGSRREIERYFRRLRDFGRQNNLMMVPSLVELTKDKFELELSDGSDLEVVPWRR